MLDDQLLWLINYYNYQCDGNLECVFGVEIQTLDNPGWRVKIRLTENYSKDKYFQEIADVQKMIGFSVRLKMAFL